MARYAIEIDGPANESAIFSPLRLKLRGRWEFGKVSHRDKGEAMKVMAMRAQIIPGQIVMVDTTEMTGTIIDPLESTPEGKAIFESIKTVCENYPFEFGGGGKAVSQPQVHSLDADGVKTWAFCMRTMVDSKIARCVSNEKLPDVNEIRAWPGKRLRDPGNSGPQEKELQKYVDAVPVEPVSHGRGRGGQHGGGAQQVSTPSS